MTAPVKDVALVSERNERIEILARMLAHARRVPTRASQD